MTRAGGAIAVNERAERLRVVAQRAPLEWNGSMRALKRLPLAEARRALATFPAIGDPGAERILMLSGAHPVLGLDSNALRVLTRLGYGRAFTQWAKSYRSAQEAAAKELPVAATARRSAYLLLRHHGLVLCRRSAPRCRECPLRPDCPAGGNVRG